MLGSRLVGIWDGILCAPSKLAPHIGRVSEPPFRGYGCALWSPQRRMSLWRIKYPASSFATLLISRVLCIGGMNLFAPRDS